MKAPDGRAPAEAGPGEGQGPGGTERADAGPPRGPSPPRAVHLLMRLYPSAFRRRFGAAMCETFAEELAEARRRGRGALAAKWVRASLRMPLLALEEHVRSAVRRIRLPRSAPTRAHMDRDRFGSLSQDLRLAVRAVVRAPGFASVSVLTVGLGVGATTSLFSLTHALLLRPLPVAAPDRLVRLQEQRTGWVSTGVEGMRVPYTRYQAYEEGTRAVFSGLAAHNFRNLSMREEGPAFPVAGVLVSGNYFDVLGVRPAAGRFFATDDEPAVVLGHRLWQQRFGGSSDVIGRPVYVNGQVMTVVGVAARDFGGTVGFLFADAWVPHRAHDGAGWPGAWVSPFGRLRPGVERARAEAAAHAVALRVPPDEESARVQGARLEAMTGMPAGMVRVVGGFVGMLLATALVVLFIACANMAGVLLARGETRRREVAVRLALGAGRGRLVRQLLTETTVLFLLGGVAGSLIAVVATRLLARLRLPVAEPVLIDASPDLRVLAFALGIAVASGVLFGLWPALRASRAEVLPALKEGGRGASSGGGRARGAFVAAQFAMSVLLLVVAGLFVRTLRQATTAHPGFTADRVVVATTNLTPHGYDAEGGRAFYAELVERVRALPGVEAAALAQVALLTGDNESRGLRPHPDAPSVSVGQNAVDAAYFGTVAIDLVSGRAIDETDVPGAPLAMVVNETLARRFWPGENPVGKQVHHGDDVYVVVGVARDGTYVQFGEEPMPFAFLSAHQHYGARRVLHVRTRPGVPAAETVAALRREVAALDADVAVERAMPLPVAVGFMLFPQRFAAFLIGLFGVLGLVLAAIGVYGVLSYDVARRSRELGIRVTLGAGSPDLLALVLGRSALLAAVGGATGLVLAAALTRFLRALLHGVSPLDPATFVAVPLLLVGVALLASYLPARRALGVDPAETLRQE